MKISERDLTKQIRDYLRLKGIFHWKNWGGPIGEKGVPDILGVLPDGKALMIEVKTETGKVSPEQESFIENASRVGAVAFIARSINDVMARGI
jgi:hypothetical protein